MRQFLVRRFSRETRQNIMWILAGTMFMALATNLFFTPANMVPGGFTGLAIIIKRLSAHLIDGGIPTWLGNLLLNVPLIIVAILVRGWKFMRRTFLAAVLFSVWLFVIPEYTLIRSDHFLVAIFGGGLMGIGLGLVFFGKATTGGTDTLAALLQKAFPHLSVAKIMPALDVIVILLSVWIFGIEISLYAAVSVILCGMVADRIISGFKNAYMAFIVSDKNREIADAIMRELDRGATNLKGKGMYTRSERPVLFCAVSKKQTADLKEIVYTLDPDAFMILNESQEIRGEGFLKFSREEL
ncbi:MAG: YitT family protein [Blautia sp.]|nr:YitT family protein [Blautia sp.]